ncbi:MAG: dienelactone hydrolase family protein [Gemmataceae bacterium]|nr:dienelactone hydrolase family protein [Gemmataceae bacterium]
MTYQPPGHFKHHRVVAGLFGLALLPLLAAPAEGTGFAATTSSTKATSSFKHAGQNITVWRYQPKTKGKHPALVMLYGMDCLAESPARYEFVAQRFAAKGYVVNFIHYFDCTPVDPKAAGKLQELLRTSLTAPAGEEDAQVRKCFRDWMGVVKAAVAFTRAQPDVDPERVGLVGFSLGGFVGMSVLVTEPDLGVAAAVQCFGGLPRALHGELKKVPPVLILHGDEDDVVPLKEAQAVKALLKERKCHVEDCIFPGCGHMFLDAKGELRLKCVLEAETICLRFLDRHLNKTGKNGR